MVMSMKPNLSHLDPTLSPTEGAILHYGQLCEEDPERHYFFCSQGAENQVVQGAISELMAVPFSTTVSPKYPLTGGPKDLRESAAGWISRFFAVPATFDNTACYFVPGRASLNLSFNMVASEAREKRMQIGTVLMGETHWPMIDGMLKSHGLRASLCANEKGSLGASMLDVLQQNPDQIDALYIPPVENPTGAQWSKNDLTMIVDATESINKSRIARRIPPIMLILDMPYYMAYNQLSNDSGAYLDTGFEGLLNDKSMVTPWILIKSESKAYGFATPCTHTVVTHPSIFKRVNSAAHTWCAGAGDVAFKTKLTSLYSPAFDKYSLQHFAGLKEKYEQNRSALIDRFGNQVVAGDASMTSLLKLPQDMFDGKEVVGEYTSDTYKLTDLNVLVDYLGREAAVMTVNNGNDRNGDFLLRVAQALEPQEFKQAMAIMQTHILKLS